MMFISFKKIEKVRRHDYHVMIIIFKRIEDNIDALWAGTSPTTA
jgi:hypothetical protein